MTQPQPAPVSFADMSIADMYAARDQINQQLAAVRVDVAADGRVPHVLAVLEAVRARRAGAWLSVSQLVDYRRDRTTAPVTRAAVDRLIKDGLIETTEVFFGHGRTPMVRLPGDADAVDVQAVQAVADAALAAVGYRVDINPARRVVANYRVLDVPYGSNVYHAYECVRPFEVRALLMPPPD